PRRSSGARPAARAGARRRQARGPRARRARAQRRRLRRGTPPRRSRNRSRAGSPLGRTAVTRARHAPHSGHRAHGPDELPVVPGAASDKALGKRATLWPSEALVSDIVGRLIEFWGFKRNMGRVWAVLYLSPEPLTAQDLRELLRLSSGAVSMILSELSRWG